MADATTVGPADIREWIAGLGIEDIVLDALMQGKDEDEDALHHLSRLAPATVEARLGGLSGSGPGGAPPVLAAISKAVVDSVAQLAAASNARLAGSEPGAAGAPCAEPSAPPPPPPFPTLECSFVDADAERLIDGSFTSAMTACPPHAPLTLNSRSPLPFETELFSGTALMLLRPPSPEADPFYSPRLFEGRSRCLEVQVQGRFKRVPKGTVYIGGEVTERMQLGLVTKGLAKLILQLMVRTPLCPLPPVFPPRPPRY
jgi:hypothetical protein